MKYTYEIIKPYLCLLFACTISGFESSVDEKLANGGFLARMLVVKPVSKWIFVKSTQPSDEEVHNFKMNNPLVEKYREIAMSGRQFEYIRFLLTENALDDYNRRNEADGRDTESSEALTMFRARMKVTLLKIAGLLYLGSPEYLVDINNKIDESIQKLGQNRNGYGMGNLGIISVTIPDKYYFIAVSLVNDFFIPTLMQVYDAILTSDSQSILNKIRTKLLNAEKHELSLTDLHRAIGGNVRTTDYHSYLDELEFAGEIYRFTAAGKGKKNITMIKLIDNDFLTPKDLEVKETVNS